MKKTTRAFTLIELLVVISIIGLLSSVVLGSLNTARAKARDAQRVGDLRAVVTALEYYRSTHGRYPPQTGNVAEAACGGGTWCLASVVQNYLVPRYISVVPGDPVYTNTTSNYRYCGGGNTTYFGIIAWNEGLGSWCRPQSASAPPTGCGGVPNTWDTYPICQ
jgi:prepilin-type N-terminal cleavage/methylation domain-containing protein